MAAITLLPAVEGIYRLAAGLLIAGLFFLLTDSPRVCRWVLGAFAANLPDLAR